VCVTRHDLTGEAWATLERDARATSEFHPPSIPPGPGQPQPQAPSRARELVAGVTAVVTAPAAVGAQPLVSDMLADAKTAAAFAPRTMSEDREANP
jgi:hypothetical protein